MPIQELVKFREKYPDYADMDDVTLAGKLATKYPESYSDLPQKVKASEYGEIKTETWQDRLKSDAINAYRNVVRPGIEMLGMAGGAAAGTGAMSVPGAALGYAGTARALDIGEEAVGLRKPTTAMNVVKQTGEDLLTGAAGELGGVAIGKGIGLISRKAGEAIRSPQVQEFVRAGKELKYPMTPAEETGTKGAALMEKALSFIPTSASVMDKYHLKQLERLTQLREEAISRVNQGKGSPEAAERIGREIKSVVDKYVIGKQNIADASTMKLVDDTLKKVGSKDTLESLQSNFKGIVEQRSQVANALKREKYNEIGKYVPEGDYETPNLAATAQKVLDKELNALEPNGQLINVSKRILKTEQNPEVANIIESIKTYPPKVQQQIMTENGITPEMVSSQKPRNWQTLQDFRVELNDLIAKNNQAMKQGSGLAGQSTREGSIFGEMKKALDKDLEGIAKDSGSEAYDRLMATNKWFSEEYAPIWKNKGIKNLAYKNPQAIIDTVFTDKFSHADAKRLIGAVGEKDYIDLQKGFVKRLIENASKSGEPTKVWESMFKQISNYGQEPLKAMFSKNPQDLNFLLSMTTKGMAGARQPVANKFFMDILGKSEPDVILKTLFHKNNVGNIRLAEKVLPKELMSEARAQWLADNVLKLSDDFKMYRPTTSAKNIGKIDQATLDAIVPKEAQSFIDNLYKVSRGAEHIEKLAGNPSGTAQSVITFQTGVAILAGAQDIITGTFQGDIGKVAKGTAKTTAMILGPKALAKLYLSPTGRSLFMRGLKLPAGSPQAAKITSQLIGVIGKENLQQDQGGSQ